MNSIVVTWGRRNYRLHAHQGGWRLRSRAAGDTIDEMFYGSPRQVKTDVAKWLDNRQPKKTRAEKATLEQVVTAYLEMPKRAGEAAAKINVSRLRSVVREAWGRELERVIVSEVGPKLWEDYQTKKLGGRLDLATRRPENAAINSALKCAASLFIPKLSASYKARCIQIPNDAIAIQWLPVLKTPKPKARDADLLNTWATTDGPMRYVVGIARFAGLRREEVSACHRDWLEMRGGVWGFWICDRPKQGFHHKTGEEYFAPLIRQGFALELLALPDGPLVRPPQGLTREQWFRTRVLDWLRPFTGESRKPLHRLRALYADELKSRTITVELAKLAGEKAAADALGHTSTKTTKDHYLSDD